ncbi:unnamed protein product [Larinioides sclopetarius]|uniref:RNase H type-1 domain-containing protein n=1 Tax=Larinioides sclopetarius TaxID=280406 RepID=A0AAV1Z152_9ARAC
MAVLVILNRGQEIRMNFKGFHASTNLTTFALRCVHNVPHTHVQFRFSMKSVCESLIVGFEMGIFHHNYIRIEGNMLAVTYLLRALTPSINIEM